MESQVFVRMDTENKTKIKSIFLGADKLETIFVMLVMWLNLIKWIIPQMYICQCL